jgi:hypothetical protein
MIFTGENRRTRRKICPSVTLSTTNPTWTDPGTNRGVRGEWPVTNCLSHGTAKLVAWKLPVMRIFVFRVCYFLSNRLWGGQQGFDF